LTPPTGFGDCRSGRSRPGWLPSRGASGVLKAADKRPGPACETGPLSSTPTKPPMPRAATNAAAAEEFATRYHHIGLAGERECDI